METSSQAKAPYNAKGLQALSNFQKGKINFRANEEWLGYQDDTIELHLLFDEATYCKQITLSTLRDHNSWIFNPVKIEILQNDDVIFMQKAAIPQASQSAALQFFDLPVATSLKEATLKIYMEKIPDWHGGKGTLPWFFIDEIIVDTNHEGH